MKKFLIKVNGNQYEVEVEEIKEDGTVSDSLGDKIIQVAQTESPEKNKKKETAAPAPSKNTSVPEGAETIKAPMPGTILKVETKTGNSVKKGDVLLVLEAMKMENELTAPIDGTVASVNVESGASVNAGDVLVSIK